MKLLLILLLSVTASANTGRFYILPSGAYSYVESVAPERLSRFVAYSPDGANFYTNADTAIAVFTDVLYGYYAAGNPALADTVLNIDSTGKPIFNQ